MLRTQLPENQGPNLKLLKLGTRSFSSLSLASPWLVAFSGNKLTFVLAMACGNACGINTSPSRY